MTNLILTSLGLENGTWMGHLQADTQPEISVSYRGDALDEVHLSPADTGWELRVQVPDVALSDGVHSFVISDSVSGLKLGGFSIIAGNAAADDLRAELDLMRAELDMLKRVFRRSQ
ncbi:hypothetical protein [Ruegeria faecimaris]|uniref:hypothetical protein n=1 Tax=Ruegeria faecimaris TaxID=686389 RepID=UPI00232E6B34|nr:hypothetical protein [Ruegeria faecimaris]